jgi:yecA family protein
MHQSSRAIDYQDLNGRLGVSELSPSAAEAHGILCAMMCSGDPEAEELWIAELLAGADDADLLTQECRRSLQDLAERTREEIASTQIGFTPLLPDESAPLADRAVGLYDWSRGFLYGLGLARVDASRLSEVAREAFGDFAAITRLDLDDLEDTEDNERALTELTELVRVAAALVYEEQEPPQGPRG